MAPRVLFRPLDWTDPVDQHPLCHSFTSTWSDTLALLCREVGMITDSRVPTDVVVQVQAADRWFRRDGTLRLDAKVNGRGVVVSFESLHGPLRYACDHFLGAAWRGMPDWQANVRAIALGLEALRKIDRYGIAQRGEQYTGWAALPSARPMNGPMTEQRALELLRLHGGLDCGPDWDDRDQIVRAWRSAVKRTHPDAGGDPDLFREVQAAYEFLAGT